MQIRRVKPSQDACSSSRAASRLASQKKKKDEEYDQGKVGKAGRSKREKSFKINRKLKTGSSTRPACKTPTSCATVHHRTVAAALREKLCGCKTKRENRDGGVQLHPPIRVHGPPHTAYVHLQGACSRSQTPTSARDATKHGERASSQHANHAAAERTRRNHTYRDPTLASQDAWSRAQRREEATTRKGGGLARKGGRQCPSATLRPQVDATADGRGIRYEPSPRSAWEGSARRRAGSVCTRGGRFDSARAEPAAHGDKTIAGWAGTWGDGEGRDGKGRRIPELSGVESFARDESDAQARGTVRGNVATRTPASRTCRSRGRSEALRSAAAPRPAPVIDETWVRCGVDGREEGEGVGRRQDPSRLSARVWGVRRRAYIRRGVIGRGPARRGGMADRRGEGGVATEDEKDREIDRMCISGRYKQVQRVLSDGTVWRNLRRKRRTDEAACAGCGLFVRRRTAMVAEARYGLLDAEWDAVK
ncbi:hypothetical protein C8J57DRAFT_1227692 [Mycena rebaudengoi]|nr:hypothetical protein C8J57DRAFT_1227692 [Mycena rebaudengoi]